MEWPILAELPPKERLEVLRLCSRRQARRGEFVCREGERGDSLFLLEKGHSLVETTTSSGDVGTFAVLGPGDVFGEQALVSGTDRRAATVVAIEPLDLLYLTRSKFEQIRGDYPVVDRFLYTIIAARLRDVTSQLVQALYSSAEERLFLGLLRLASAYSEENSNSIRIPLTQDQIASLAGTTRPTANRVLQEAAHAGAIRLGRGSIVICDQVLLKRLAMNAERDA